MHTLFAIGAVCAVTIGCSPKDDSDGLPVTTNTAESAAASITSAEASALESSADMSSFAGKWTGPEGTSLTVAPQGTGYLITVVNLDGPRDFPGTPQDDGIAFTRDGQTFVIHKGTGEDTGMKWLAGKHDCIVVAPSEGYCHD